MKTGWGIAMNKTLKLLLKIAVSAGLICLLYSKLDWSDLADKLRGADLRWLGLAFALMVLNTFLLALYCRHSAKEGAPNHLTHPPNVLY